MQSSFKIRYKKDPNNIILQYFQQNVDHAAW